ncbi:MAG: hypothetical protein AAGA62_18705, partial [Bacteroidota bacterium]
AWWRILFHGPGLTLDKEKNYGFYQQEVGADAGAMSASSGQRPGVEGKGKKAMKVEEVTPNNVVV